MWLCCQIDRHSKHAVNVVSYVARPQSKCPERGGRCSFRSFDNDSISRNQIVKREDPMTTSETVQLGDVTQRVGVEVAMG